MPRNPEARKEAERRRLALKQAQQAAKEAAVAMVEAMPPAPEGCDCCEHGEQYDGRYHGPIAFMCPMACGCHEI